MARRPTGERGRIPQTFQDPYEEQLPRTGLVLHGLNKHFYLYLNNNTQCLSSRALQAAD